MSKVSCSFTPLAWGMYLLILQVLRHEHGQSQYQVDNETHGDPRKQTVALAPEDIICQHTK